MRTSLEVLLAPAEFAALPERDLRNSVCVVFDILRATSSMVTALANGAAAIAPVTEIAKALGLQEADPSILLAGERDGLRIGSELTGGVRFDLGNSPREFTREKVAGRRIVTTTTNGTRALRACARASSVLVASFLNLKATAECLAARPNLILVCSGTHEEAAYEDALAAGALCDLIWSSHGNGAVSDSARMCLKLYELEQGDLLAGISKSRNGQRLLANPDLRDDVSFSAQRDIYGLVAEMGGDWIRTRPGEEANRQTVS